MWILSVKIRTELSPFRSTEATVATSKVIIGRKSPTECAKESMKISSDAKDSNEFFDVCCAYVRCHCGLFFRKKRFSAWKRNTLEIMFQLKYVGHDPNFAKITEKMHFPLSRGDALQNQTFLFLHPLGCIKRKLYPIKIHQTSANCLTSLSCCRKTSYVL